MEPPGGNDVELEVDWSDDFLGKAGSDAERVKSTSTAAPCHDADTIITGDNSQGRRVLSRVSLHTHPSEGGPGLNQEYPQEGTMMDGGSGTSRRVLPEIKDASSIGGTGPAKVAAAGAAAGKFLCYECGLDFHSVKELQLHMVRKTAWSNQGLIGCRVSCLVDNREWHEGLVTQYHKSGKHCVEYRRSGEKRWVNMLKTAFYIVERAQPTGGEVKEMESDPTEGLAPIEKWHYQEDISPEFCVALSLLHRAYGCRIQETGHKTVGHTCVTDRDKLAAKEVKGSLLYGELLPRGVNKAMGPKHLNAAKASTIYDLGMGTGKVAMQVFLQFPNLSRVYGIELSQGRFQLGEAAMFALMELQPGAYAIKKHIPGKFLAIETLPRKQQQQGGNHNQPQQHHHPSLAEGGNRREGAGGAGDWEHICRGPPGRTLEFACGNLFDVSNISHADLVLLETDVSLDVHPQLSRFLTGMRKGSQALTYLDLQKMWSNLPFPYRQVEVNRSLSDRFPTSWSVHRGHHFFLWSKTLHSLEISSWVALAAEDGEESSTAAAVKTKDKRRDRQGYQLSSTCSRGNLGVGDGEGGVEGRSDSARSGGSSVLGLGGVFAGIGGGGGGGSKGRRGGHSKFRIPFLACLGFRRRVPSSTLSPPGVYEEGLHSADVGAVEVANISSMPRPFAGDGVEEHPSQELSSLDARGGSSSRRPPPPGPELEADSLRGSWRQHSWER